MEIHFLDTVHNCLKEQLERAGHSCHFQLEASYEELLQSLSQAEGIVIRSRVPIDKKLLESCPKLKVVMRAGAGLENIDCAYAKSRGIAVISSPEGNRDAVAEHAIGMLLTLFNRLNIVDREVRDGIWLRAENRGVELKSQTVGIVGYGHMGQALAQRLEGFSCNILAHDKYKKGFAKGSIQECSLEQLHENATVISLHLPESKECHHYLDQNFIDKMKHPFYLINTARGKNVNTKALVKGLQSGKILGACLDVFEFEKKSFASVDGQANPEWDYLCQSSQVILSPHIAGWTHESHQKLSQVLFDKFIQLFPQF